MIIEQGIKINPGMVFSELDSTYTLNYLLVAGGGGGGPAGATGGIQGSGGGGGVVSGTMEVTNLFPSTYTVTVGARGSIGLNGGNSRIFLGNVTSTIAIGGGAGGEVGIPGKDGGSGGGAGCTIYTSIPNFGGQGTPGQGNEGGNSFYYVAGNGYSDGIGGGGGGGSKIGGYDGGGLGGNGSSYYSTLLSTISTATPAVPVGENVGGTYYVAGGGGSVGGRGGGGTSSGRTAIAGTGGGGSPVQTGATGLVIAYYTSPVQRGIGGTVTSSGTGDTKVWYHVYKGTSGTFISKGA